MLTEISDSKDRKMNDTGIKLRVIEEIKELAQKYKIKRVILFGSRARGDYHKTSDIDLATEGGNHVRFALDVDELTTTLLKYDIIDLDGPVQEELRQAIREEGILLYEEV